MSLSTDLQRHRLLESFAYEVRQLVGWQRNLCAAPTAGLSPAGVRRSRHAAIDDGASRPELVGVALEWFEMRALTQRSLRQHLLHQLQDH